MSDKELYHITLRQLSDLITDSEAELFDRLDEFDEYWTGYMTGQLNGFLITRALLATTYNDLLARDL